MLDIFQAIFMALSGRSVLLPSTKIGLDSEAKRL